MKKQISFIVVSVWVEFLEEVVSGSVSHKIEDYTSLKQNFDLFQNRKFWFHVIRQSWELGEWFETEIYFIFIVMSLLLLCFTLIWCNFIEFDRTDEVLAFRPR